MSELSPELTPDEFADESQDEVQDHFILEELSPERQRKVKLIEEILNAPSKEEKRKRIAIAALELGKSIKTIKRYCKLLRKDGVAALVRTERSDKGSSRHISRPWINLVLELRRRGQRDSRCENINQIWLLIQGLIYKLGTANWRELGPLQALIQWFAQKLGSAKENAKSKLNKILGSIRKELEAGILKPPRSHTSVYKIINEYEDQVNRTARHPGQGPDKFVLTTDGRLPYKYTNDLFQADHTGLDLLLVDKDGNEIGYPFLTVIIECTSGCVVGFYLGFYQPSSHEVALALRHAILPKQYAADYDLKHEWICRGVPKYLMTDRAREFKSKHLSQIAAELGFQLRYRAYPSQGGLVESVFDKINKEVLSKLPGYKGSNIQKRPKDAQKYACLTVEELERVLVRYLVNHYNWHLHPGVKNRTRFQHWEEMLMDELNIPEEAKLDLCLLKRDRRAKVQKYGTVNFFNEVYSGDCLLGHEKEYITLRYDPSNIIHVLAYTEEKPDIPSRRLGILKARDLEENMLSLKSLKLRQHLKKKEGQAIDQSSIFLDALDLNELAEEKARDTRKQKRHKEHERAGCSDGLTNLLQFVSPEVDENDSQSLQPPSVQQPVKRLEPKGSATIAVTNWNQQLD